MQSIALQDPSQSAQLYARFEGLQKPKTAAEFEAKKVEAAQDVANKFEGMLVQMMVSGMRESTDILGEGNSMFGSGPGADTYTQWFDEQMSTHITGAGGVGVADVLMEEIVRTGQIDPQALQAKTAITKETR